MKNMPSLLESICTLSTEEIIFVIIEVTYEPFNSAIYSQFIVKLINHEDGELDDERSGVLSIQLL